MSRPKLLIVGSGFHKHILHGSRSPLSCWNLLLREVAEKHRLGHVLSQSSQWETLVTAAVQKYKNQRRKASTFEEKLRKDVAEILRGEVIKHEQA